MIFEAIKKVLSGNSGEIAEALKSGATLIDVRSAGEFSGGSVPGAINIPHDEMRKNKAKVQKMKQPLILFCASGMRSAAATQALKTMGIENVINGKTWGSVNAIVRAN
ncbi:MAG: rhodanese-like domain-containing protein [Fibrobacterales bacterium]